MEEAELTSWRFVSSPFSLDLSKPIELNIHADGDVDQVMDALKPYLAE